MKQFIFLFLVVVNMINAVIPLNAPVETKTTTVSSDLYGPFVEYNDDVLVDIHINFYGERMMAREKINVYHIDDLSSALAYDCNDNYLHLYGKTYSASLILPLKKTLSKEGIVVEFLIQQFQLNHYTTVYSSKQIIYPVTNDILDATGNIAGKRTYFSLDASIKQETFNFSTLDRGIEEDNYYYFSPSFEIAYSFTKPFICGEASLIIDDRYNVFPYLDTLIYQYKIVHLSYRQRNTHVSFFFSQSFYVDIDTLYISSAPKEGFVVTSYFFLPKGMKEQVEKTSFKLSFTRCGYSGYNFEKKLSVFFGNNLFGDCTDSSYCVVGGER